MRTTLNIEDHLFGDLIELTGARTKTEAVRKALHEFVRWRRKQQLLALRGNLDIEDGWSRLRELDKAEVPDG